MDNGTDKKTKQLIIIVICMLIFFIGAANDAAYWLGTGKGQETHQSIFKILDIF